MFSNLSTCTFTENANNEESDQTGLLGGGGGGFYTKSDLTKPHLATRSNIFPNVCAKSLSCIEAILLHHFFQRDTSFVTTANETGGKYESGRVASPESVPSNKNGIHSTHL